MHRFRLPEGDKSPLPLRADLGPGQESVWDYPRPPRWEAVSKRLRVVCRGETIADTTRGYRILETSHPPVYYFPPEDVRTALIKPSAGLTFCEWKGNAQYVDVVFADARIPRAGWTYSRPTQGFLPLKDHLAFYARPMDGCFVDDEPVLPQSGCFYGGWITSEIVGPFKGEPGTEGW